MNDEAILQKAIDLIIAGEREKGKRILIHMVKKDPNNERAWLCLVKTTEKEDQKLQLVEKVLAIDPQNEIANKLYTKIHHEHALQSGASRPISVEKNGTQPVNHQGTHSSQNSEYSFLDSGYDDLEFDPESCAELSQLGKRVSSVQLESGFQFFDSEYEEPDFNPLSDPAASDWAVSETEITQDPMLALLESGYQDDEFNLSLSRDGSTADFYHATLDPPGRSADQRPKSNDAFNKTPIDMKLPDKVFEFEASLVISRGKSALGRIFSFNIKEKSTRTRIKVAPDVELIHVQGLDLLVQNEQYLFHFHNIKALETSEVGCLTIILMDGREIKVKEMESLGQFLNLLPSSLPLTTSQQIAAQFADENTSYRHA